jgi:hypothetical protein
VFGGASEAGRGKKGFLLENGRDEGPRALSKSLVGSGNKKAQKKDPKILPKNCQLKLGVPHTNKVQKLYLL